MAVSADCRRSSWSAEHAWDGALSKLATAVGYARSAAEVRARLTVNATDKASKAGAVAAPGK